MDFHSKTEKNPSATTEDRVEIVKSILYPESLENSKIISHLNEDLVFNIDDLHNLKEVKKAYENKEELLSLLKELNFVKLSDNSCQIIINDDLTIYSLINVPAKLNKEDLIKELSLTGKESFARVYKKYFVWLLVSDNNAENEKIEENLKKEKLKFDVTLGKNLKKVVQKRITYNKESSDLKAHHKPEHTLGASSHPEAGSWRKKSNDGEDNLTGKKFGKAEPQVSNFKRKRFNSDTGVDENPSTTTSTAEKIFKNEKIVPSSQIKFRYSLKEMADFFNNSKGKFDKKPKFSNVIEEVCIENKRTSIHVLDEVLESKRDRSKTFHYQANEFSAFTQKQINLPKNNPLQDINNFDFHNSKNQGHQGNQPHHGNQNQQNKANYGSNNQKNKFDFAN